MVRTCRHKYKILVLCSPMGITTELLFPQLTSHEKHLANPDHKWRIRYYSCLQELHSWPKQAMCSRQLQIHQRKHSCPWHSVLPSLQHPSISSSGELGLASILCLIGTLLDWYLRKLYVYHGTLYLTYILDSMINACEKNLSCRKTKMTMRSKVVNLSTFQKFWRHEGAEPQNLPQNSKVTYVTNSKWKWKLLLLHIILQQMI